MNETNIEYEVIEEKETEMVPVPAEEETTEVATSGGNLSKVAIGLGVTVVAAGAAAWVKTKDKRAELKEKRQKKAEEKLIKKLEKKGYTVVHVEELEDAVVDEDDIK